MTLEEPERKLDDLEKESINWAKVFVDWLILCVSFLIAYGLKRGRLSIEPAILRVIPLYFICWLISSFLTKKFRVHSGERRKSFQLAPYFYSFLYFTGSISFFLYGLHWVELPRFVVFGSIGIYLFFEILIISGNYLPLFQGEGKQEKRGFSLSLFILEFVLIVLSFLTVYILRRGTFVIETEYRNVLALMLFGWAFIGLLSHRFIIPTERNFLKLIYPFIRSNLTLFSIVTFSIIGFQVVAFSRVIVFGSLILFAAMEFMVLAIHYLYNLPRKTDIPEINVFESPLLYQEGRITKVVNKEKGKKEKYSLNKKVFKGGLVYKKLKKVYLKDFPGVFNFLNRNIELDTINILKAEVMETNNPYNVEVLPEDSLEFFLNLSPLNGQRRVNKYLAVVNRKIRDGGVFVGKFEPAERRYIYFRQKYPRSLGRFLYFFDFIWKRVFPKTPILTKIYFAVTKGRSRVFSMAQALGRLYYCGFEVISLHKMDQFVFFIVKKVKEPLTEAPSYGMFFKQRRVGLKRKVIFIYKMRTMYPFSEYIHQYILDRFDLDEKGKVKDDFRITTWGKVFRIFWIDELPMMINLLKRDLKLIGVRPLSETFFATYPKDLQEKRTKFRPGLIPPYYADMPKSMTEIWESEHRYLDSYAKHPIRTNFRYFFKAVYNIVFKRAKSR
jgi:lipopolysaccharide/colanic/teichoic acid biosynthesis glycosyltransferase